MKIMGLFSPEKSRLRGGLMAAAAPGSSPDVGGHGTGFQGSGHGPELPEFMEHLNSALRNRV